MVSGSGKSTAILPSLVVPVLVAVVCVVSSKKLFGPSVSIRPEISVASRMRPSPTGAASFPSSPSPSASKPIVEAESAGSPTTESNVPSPSTSTRAKAAARVRMGFVLRASSRVNTTRADTRTSSPGWRIASPPSKRCTVFTPTNASGMSVAVKVEDAVSTDKISTSRISVTASFSTNKSAIARFSRTIPPVFSSTYSNTTSDAPLKASTRVGPGSTLTDFISRKPGKGVLSFSGLPSPFSSTLPPSKSLSDGKR